MQQSLVGIVAGVASGVAVWLISHISLGYTSAVAMPGGFSLYAWNALVVFGVGASLVALLVHFSALRVSKAGTALALAAFVGTVSAVSALTGHFPEWLAALAAWSLGALLASILNARLKPNNSSKPTPLRGAA